jgi:CDP-diacylglycerol--inositol 3-phosphatidyltransferase
MGPIPVVLYVPNLLGYTRILLAFVGLYLAPTNPIEASIVWLLSASLDLIDGISARALNQCSSLGVLLDISADNILRTAFWLAAASSSSSSAPWYRLAAGLVISLEWATMLCTQLHASQEGAHWKTTREQDPGWIKAIFADNFRTPLGTLCIGGLSGSGYMAYASGEEVLVRTIPCFQFLMYLCFFGRGVAMLAELWLCSGYLALVVERDTRASLCNANKKT